MDTKKNLLLLSEDDLGAREWIQPFFGASPEHRKKVLFVPYALKEYDKYSAEITTALKPLGIDVISAHASDNPAALLDAVDGVFIGGGNTFRLLDTLQKTGLLDAIKRKVENGMPYMGASAGINVACPTIKTTNDMPIVQPRSLDAMGLVPFQINPHYVDGKFYYIGDGGMTIYHGESRDDRLNEFFEENSAPVVALREGTALLINGKKVELLGDKPAKIFQSGKNPVDVTDGNLIADLLELPDTKQRSHAVEGTPVVEIFLTPSSDTTTLSHIPPKTFNKEPGAGRR